MPVVQLIEGIRPGSKVYCVDDGYQYHLNRRLNHSELSLRCVHYRTKGCHARAVCSVDLKDFRLTQRHILHSKDKSALQGRYLRRKILEKCASRHPARFSDIVRDESRGFSRKARSKNTAVRLRTAMRRARMKFFPKVPSNFAEVHKLLKSEKYKHLSRTISDSSFLYAGMSGAAEDKSRSLIFSSLKMREAMRKAKNIFSDGTWDGRPAKPESSQVFSILTTYNHQIVPLCVAVMERKTKKAYRNLFRFLKRVCPEFSPTSIHCDFESAQYGAYEKEFPMASVYGCLYHFAKAVCQYAKSLGFSERIKTDATFRSIVRSCMAIPLVPQNYLKEALSSVMKRADAADFYDEMSPFLEYIYDEWITKKKDQLSVFGAIDRTSNCAESWNAKLQAAVVVDRPNFFMFLDGLLNLEEEAEQNIYCLLRGIPTTRPRKVSAINNDTAIKNLISLMLQGRLSTSLFLRRASFRLSAPFHEKFPECT